MFYFKPKTLNNKIINGNQEPTKKKHNCLLIHLRNVFSF